MRETIRFARPQQIATNSNWDLQGLTPYVSVLNIGVAASRMKTNQLHFES